MGPNPPSANEFAGHRDQVPCFVTNDSARPRNWQGGQGDAVVIGTLSGSILGPASGVAESAALGTDNS